MSSVPVPASAAAAPAAADVVRSAVRALVRAVPASPEGDLASRLFLLGLVLRPAGSYAPRALVVAAAALALLGTRWVRTPAVWLVLATLLGLRLFIDWPLSDNHAYLTAYWCLAVGLAYLTAEPRQSVKLATRQLLALTFALAVIWKAFLSPDYLDGRFFRVTFLRDARFTNTVMLLTGMTREDIDFDRQLLRPPPPGIEPFDWQPLRQPPAFKLLAHAVTWTALATEALVALLFLVPLGERGSWARNGALIFFCLTTYAFAPVPGFGWLLLAMGLAQCPADSRRWRVAYAMVFFLVLFYTEVPWAALALNALG